MVPPILFATYLEAALKTPRPLLNCTKLQTPNELSYADDVDFIFDTRDQATSSIPTIVNTLKQYNLIVNPTKTEITTVDRNTNDWHTVKKLGSLLHDQSDVHRRKLLATIAFRNMDKIWIRTNTISEQSRIKLYNTLVLPILLYNCGTWSLTQSQLNSIDAYHRKQLRQLLRIFYPKTITNNELYTRCNVQPLSTIIHQRRYNLTGHILRRDKNIPAQKAIENYFTNTLHPKYRGRTPNNLAIITNKDIAKAFPSINDQTYAKTPQLKSIMDVDPIREIANNRPLWRCGGLRLQD